MSKTSSIFLVINKDISPQQNSLPVFLHDGIFKNRNAVSSLPSDTEDRCRMNSDKEGRSPLIHLNAVEPNQNLQIPKPKVQDDAILWPSQIIEELRTKDTEPTKVLLSRPLEMIGDKPLFIKKNSLKRTRSISNLDPKADIIHTGDSKLCQQQVEGTKEVHRRSLRLNPLKKKQLASNLLPHSIGPISANTNDAQKVQLPNTPGNPQDDKQSLTKRRFLRQKITSDSQQKEVTIPKCLPTSEQDMLQTAAYPDVLQVSANRVSINTSVSAPIQAEIDESCKVQEPAAVKNDGNILDNIQEATTENHLAGTLIPVCHATGKCLMALQSDTGLLMPTSLDPASQPYLQGPGKIHDGIGERSTPTQAIDEEDTRIFRNMAPDLLYSLTRAANRQEKLRLPEWKELNTSLTRLYEVEARQHEFKGQVRTDGTGQLPKRIEQIIELHKQATDYYVTILEMCISTGLTSIITFMANRMWNRALEPVLDCFYQKHRYQEMSRFIKTTTETLNQLLSHCHKVECLGGSFSIVTCLGNILEYSCIAKKHMQSKEVSWKHETLKQCYYWIDRLPEVGTLYCVLGYCTPDAMTKIFCYWKALSVANSSKLARNFLETLTLEETRHLDVTENSLSRAFLQVHERIAQDKQVDTTCSSVATVMTLLSHWITTDPRSLSAELEASSSELMVLLALSNCCAMSVPPRRKSIQDRDIQIFSGNLFNLMIAQVGNLTVLPFVHVSLVFMNYAARHKSAVHQDWLYLLDSIAWASLAVYINKLSDLEWGGNIATECGPLQEDFMMRGLPWSLFGDWSTGLFEREPVTNIARAQAERVQRVPGLGRELMRSYGKKSF